MVISTDEDFLIIISVVVVVVALLAFPDPSTIPIRAVIGIPFVLFFPGYSFTTVIFPKARSEINVLERILISLGISISFVIITGLGVNYFYGSLSIDIIAYVLGVITVALMTYGYLRR